MLILRIRLMVYMKYVGKFFANHKHSSVDLVTQRESPTVVQRMQHFDNLEMFTTGSNVRNVTRFTWNIEFTF